MPINSSPQKPGSPPAPYQAATKYDPRTSVPGPPLPTEQKKSGCGCWFYGCFFLLLLVIGIIASIYFGLRSLSHTLQQGASTESTASEALLEKYTLADFQRVNKKIEDFFMVLKTAKGEPEIYLTADDFNTLIAFRPDWHDLKGKLLLEISGDEIITNISMPLEEVGIAGRFVNIRAHWLLHYANDDMVLKIKNIEVAGMKLPDALSKEIESKNMGEEVLSKSSNRQALRSVEKIEVTGGKLYIKVKKEALPLEMDETSSEEQEV